MKVSAIEKHLDAIDKLLKSPLSELGDIKGHLRFITSFPILIFKIPKGTKIYRSSTSFTNEYFTTVSRISYPPKIKVANFGRANIPGQSLFYCSENQATSYLELINFWVKNISRGQLFYVTMSEWETTDVVESIVITSPEVEYRKSQFEISSGNVYDMYEKRFDSDQRKVARLFYGKLANWYSKPARVGNNIYPVTSNMTNKLFTISKSLGLLKYASISYPSVANIEEGVNFAFEPKIVDKGSISPKRVWRIKLLANQKDDGFYHFTEVERKNGVIEDNKFLKWKY